MAFNGSAVLQMEEPCEPPPTGAEEPCEPRPTGLLDLPPDLLRRLASFCDRSAATLAHVCRATRHVWAEVKLDPQLLVRLLTGNRSELAPQLLRQGLLRTWMDADAMQSLLTAGTDVDAFLGYALCMAACHGHADVVRVLLAHGANACACGGAPLLLAAQHGHAEAAQLLLAHGADLSVTALTARMAYRSTLMINRTQAWYLRDDKVKGVPEGRYPLTLAVEEGHMAVVRALVEHGADPSAGDCRAMQRAVRKGDVGVMRLLVECCSTGMHAAKAGPPNDLEGSSGQGGRAAACWCMLARGPHALAMGEALAAAAESGRVNELGAVLDNVRQSDVAVAATAVLCKYVCTKRVEVVRVLLEHGACVHAHGGRRYTSPGCGSPLSEAVHRGDVAMAQLLLAHGADVADTIPVDAQRAQKIRRTKWAGREVGLLQWAARRGGGQMVRLLVGAGADAMEGGGEALLLSAVTSKKGAVDVVEALLECGCWSDDAVRKAFRKSNQSVLDVLLLQHKRRRRAACAAAAQAAGTAGAGGSGCADAHDGGPEAP